MQEIISKMDYIYIIFEYNYSDGGSKVEGSFAFLPYASSDWSARRFWPAAKPRVNIFLTFFWEILNFFLNFKSLK